MPVNSFENYPMSWKPTIENRSNSLCKELALQLEKDISEGVLKPGTMLPPQRELADYLDINLSTISRAFKLCEQKGLILGVVGRGTFVASDVMSSGVFLRSSREEKLIEMGAIVPAIDSITTLASLIIGAPVSPTSYSNSSDLSTLLPELQPQ